MVFKYQVTINGDIIDNLTMVAFTYDQNSSDLIANIKVEIPLSALDIHAIDLSPARPVPSRRPSNPG